MSGITKACLALVGSAVLVITMATPVAAAEPDPGPPQIVGVTFRTYEREGNLYLSQTGVAINPKWWASVIYDTGLIEVPWGIQAYQLRGYLYSDPNAHRLPIGVM
ncbi:MAG: hypothetical protein AB7K08_00140 [Microbacteriaceae bacterium]